MIITEYGKSHLVCDCCGVKSEGLDSFDEVVEAKEELGYKSKKYNDEWIDLCSDCTE